MGCISSKKEIDDIYPNVFQVMNVDEQGNRINPGQLEITDVDLVLYQQGKPPIKWPLRTLRRYGFDSEHFSFESGRRCQTGPGIYAFRCRRAEQLFNLLQSRIQIRNNGETGDGSENLSGRDAGYLEPTSIRRTNAASRFSSQNGIPRLSSAASTSGSVGPLSPQSATSQSFPLDNSTIVNPVSRPLSQNLYANEDVIASVIQDVEETNNNKTTEESVSPPAYSNIVSMDGLPIKDLNCNGDAVNPVEGNHLYMNIIPGVGNVIPRNAAPGTVDWEPEEPVHNYANFDAEIGLVCKPTSSPTPQPPTKKLNYIVLDLEPCSDLPKPTGQPESPRKLTGGYAAIDFKKTVALSHSVNPNFDNDSEGSRKTRHNSNINDLITYEA
ncbi:UNVERIFIED_CONTAM: hypothetical protein PYX00_008915 [Menopon gallinae]|uniref:IRS-type PTB domain-containing protein n=1 Tax=Menopon gallinae TaxID=328185 RepID=A0AAW2H997_9NEOP